MASSGHETNTVYELYKCCKQIRQIQFAWLSNLASNGHESPALISAFINCRPCSRSASLLKKSRTTLQGSSLPPATLMEVFSFRVIYVVRMSDKKEPTQAKELLLAVRHLDVGARPLPRQAQLLLSSHAIALACCSSAITACHRFFLLIVNGLFW